MFPLGKKTGGKQTNQIIKLPKPPIHPFLMVFLWCFFPFLQCIQVCFSDSKPTGIRMSACLGAMEESGVLPPTSSSFTVLRYKSTSKSTSLQIVTDFSPANLDDVDGFWVIFLCFFGGKHTPCPSRMPVSNQGVELTPSRSVTRRWGENQKSSERLRFGDGKLSWNAWNMGTVDILSGWWFQFFFHLYLGKIPILTDIFQRGWNHQLVIHMQYYIYNIIYISSWI